MPNNPRKESTTLTIRVGKKQKQEWMSRARKAGMSLTLYVCYVLDRTDIKVSLMTAAREDEAPPPRR